ncbi:hypothetical protein AB1N83_000097 [Pleurotus pulmonarius]
MLLADVLDGPQVGLTDCDHGCNKLPHITPVAIKCTRVSAPEQRELASNLVQGGLFCFAAWYNPRVKVHKGEDAFDVAICSFW